MSNRFELDRFVEDCRSALGQAPAQKSVREVLARALADPSAIVATLGEPQRGGVETLHQSADLTIINVVWAPYMTVMPHNHNMWAVIGLYGGREDNVFWRRLEEVPDRIEAAGAQAIATGELTPLGHNVIHSVTNPLGKLSGAIHIYGGDFFDTERSEWDPETLVEGAYDVNKTLKLFEEANARSGPLA